MQPSAQPLSKPPVGAGLTARTRTIALWVVLLAFFMDVLDTTIVNVAIPSIQANLGASYSAIQWIIAGYALTFGLGCALVGASGTLLVLMRDATPILSLQFTLMAFIVVIIGGLGSMAGALIGGVLIGVSEALAGFLLMPSLKSLFSYGLLILVLLLRPEGLMGKRT